MVRDLVIMLLVALAGALVACVPGALLLRRLHRRSITLNILVLQVITVLAVLAGVLAVAAEMFISTHDLHVVLIVVPLAGFLGLATAWWAGKRMTRAAVWAEDGTGFTWPRWQVVQLTAGLSLRRLGIFFSSPVMVPTIFIISRAICLVGLSSFSHAPATWQCVQSTPSERA